MPGRIDCATLVSPAGLKLGSKMEMIQHILIPLLLFKHSSSDKYLEKVANRMSDNCMKEFDRQIIGDIFRYVKLEQEMPKLTGRKIRKLHFTYINYRRRKRYFLSGKENQKELNKSCKI